MSLPIPAVIRDYIFLPSGEAVRALEVTIGTAIVETAYKDDWSQLGNWKVYAIGLVVAGITAGVAALKDMLPGKTSSTIRGAFKRR